MFNKESTVNNWKVLQEKEVAERQYKSALLNVNSLTKQLNKANEQIQQLTFDVRKAVNKCDEWKQRVEECISASKNELFSLK